MFVPHIPFRNLAPGSWCAEEEEERPLFVPTPSFHGLCGSGGGGGGIPFSLFFHFSLGSYFLGAILLSGGELATGRAQTGRGRGGRRLGEADSLFSPWYSLATSCCE